MSRLGEGFRTTDTCADGTDGDDTDAYICEAPGDRITECVGMLEVEVGGEARVDRVTECGGMLEEVVGGEAPGDRATECGEILELVEVGGERE